MRRGKYVTSAYLIDNEDSRDEETGYVEPLRLTAKSFAELVRKLAEEFGIDEWFYDDICNELVAFTFNDETRYTIEYDGPEPTDEEMREAKVAVL
jgi:hypothetical protein